MCMKAAIAAAAAAINYDGDDENIKLITDEQSLRPANSTSQRTSLDGGDNDIDYISTGANEAADNVDIDNSDYDDDNGLLRQLSLSQTDSGNKNKSHMTGDDGAVSAKRQLPTLAGHVSALRQHVHDETTLHPLNEMSSSSSWRSVNDGHQQLNHVVISEKRRLALQKQRRLEHKLRSDTDTQSLYSIMPMSHNHESHKT